MEDQFVLGRITKEPDKIHNRHLIKGTRQLHLYTQEANVSRNLKYKPGKNKIKIQLQTENNINTIHKSFKIQFGLTFFFF